MNGPIALRHRPRTAVALLLSAVLTTTGGALAPLSAGAATSTHTIRGSIVVPQGVSAADYLDGVSLEWSNDAWKVGADNAYGHVTLDERTGAFSITGVGAGNYTIRLAGSTTVNGTTVTWDGKPGPVEPMQGDATGGGGVGWGVDTPVSWATVADTDATAEPVTAPAFGVVTGKLVLSDALPSGEVSDLFLEAKGAGDMPWDVLRASAPVRAGVLSQTWRHTADAGTFDVDVAARAYVGGTFKVWRHVGSARITVPAFGTTTMNVVEQRPVITGTAKVGQKLRASAGTWPPGSEPTFQWLRGGKAISRATSSSYAITTADAGAKLSVRVSGPSSASTISRTSAEVTVAKATLTTSTPTIAGTARVGQKLTARPGAWTAGTSFTYQWLRNGKAIAGAKKATYVTTGADAKKKLSVRVTGTRAGYSSATKTSSTKTVAAGTLTAVTPRITGTAKVGRTLKVTAGTWTSGTKLTYQWRANGVALKGATKQSYKVAASVRGKRISATVTGTKSGYATKKVTSRSTASVAR
ncbi:MAG TPA: hypothetical protein DHW40_07990 [Microbacterium sp.]|nr:hypothetical protein [Microbacterium sp.]